MHDDATFPKRERLQYGHQFRLVYDHGRRVVGRCLVLHVLESVPETPAAASAAPLVGVVTSRRIGNAVRRNRARRLLREAYRLNKHKLKPNLQIVMVARSMIREQKLAVVETELLRLSAALGLVRDS